MPPTLELSKVTPYRIAKLVEWLDDPRAQGKARAERVKAKRDEARREGQRVSSRPIEAKPAPLSPATIARAVMPLRSLLRTATKQGLLRANPALGLELPGEPDRPDAEHVEGEESGSEEVKVFAREQLATVLAVVNRRHRLLFELLATTGLRISEAIALEWRHVKLDGDRPHVAVRRAIVRGKLGAPKSRHGKRDVALPLSLVRKLRAARLEADAGPGGLVFPSERGTPLAPGNLRRRTLRVALEEAGAGWAGFHTFRHTFASMQLAKGCNIVALSRALGHHSPAFTLSVYAHLLEGDEAPALDVLEEVADWQRAGNGRDRTPTHEEAPLEADFAAPAGAD